MSAHCEPFRDVLRAAPFHDVLTALQARADELPQEHIGVALSQLSAVQSGLSAVQGRLAARLVMPPQDRRATHHGDRLLTIEQAAAKLGGVKVGWLYRHAPHLPFTVRVSPRRLRFSELGIDKYIAQRRAS
jgi:predicted DNA-binding transcriptional regulator AlpA